MPSFKSWKELERYVNKLNREAMQEVVDESFKDAHENVDHFYDSPEGVYKRTGQLAESVEQEFKSGTNSASGSISLDTSYRYNLSGQDTKTIYGYAESGGLLGNGGFWEQTKDDVKKNIDKSYGKRFSKQKHS